MLGRQQQQLILLVGKDQQVLQMGKTITRTKRNICIHMHWEVALDLSELFRWTIFVVLSHYFNVYYFLTLFAT
jgi:hypothetical protein